MRAATATIFKTLFRPSAPVRIWDKENSPTLRAMALRVLDPSFDSWDVVWHNWVPLGWCDWWYPVAHVIAWCRCETSARCHQGLWDKRTVTSRLTYPVSIFGEMSQNLLASSRVHCLIISEEYFIGRLKESFFLFRIFCEKMFPAWCSHVLRQFLGGI